MIWYKRILLFLFICLQHQLFAQADTAFWFAAPEITVNNIPATSPHSDRPIFLRVTAFTATANVVITQPANPSFIPIVFFVAPNTSQSIDLTSRIDMLETKPANTILNYGLKVTSDNLITAYYEENSPSNPEMFVLKGKNALGTDFFIPSQNILNNWDFYTYPTPVPTNSFDIVATENNTTVTITPAQDIVGRAAGVPFTIVLNRGQTYSATGVGRLAAQHLMGSIISSDKPIAVTIKDDSIGGPGYGGCLDLAGDQIVPTRLIGRKYITLPGFLTDPVGTPTDQVFLLATQNNTTIRINGVLEATINTGQTYRRPSMNEVLYIETSNPTYALHLSGFGCEVGYALLPQIECTGSSKVAFTRSASTPLFMNILVPAGYENQFTFNGNPAFINASLFADVPSTSGQWKYARIPIPLANLAVGAGVIVQNAGIEFHLSIIHGDGNTGCRYGYFSDFNSLDVTIASNAVNGALCANTSLSFTTDFRNALGVNFNWTGPNGFSSTQANPPVINNITSAGSGTYTLTANKFSCVNAVKSLAIVVNPIPTPNPSSNAPICTGGALNLTANYPLATYNWTGPNGFSSVVQNPIRNNVTILDSGTYSVTATANGCSGTANTIVVLGKTPNPKINVSLNNACRLNTSQLTNIAGATPLDTTYSWIGPNGFTSNNSNLNFPAVNYTDTGMYVLTTSYLGCNAKDSARLTLREIPNIQFNSLPSVCSNVQQFNLLANETTGLAGNGTFSGIGIVNNSGLFNPALVTTPTTTIRYSFIATNGCVANTDRNITVSPTPQITIPNRLGVVFGNQVQINASINGGSNNNFAWTPTIFLDNPLILSPFSKPSQSVTYTLTAISDSNCIAQDTVRVELASNIVIPNAFSPNSDGINDKWVIEDLAGILTIRANVFDRYGKLLHTSFGFKIGWDGNFQGKPLPVATYYYVVVVSDGQTVQNYGGWVQLLR